MRKGTPLGRIGPRAGKMSALALALLLAACAADMGEAAGIPSGDGCERAGCPFGQVCTANGACVAEAYQAMTISLRLVPPTESNLLEEHLEDLEITGTTFLQDVVLSRPTRVEGDVFYSIDGDRQPVAGRLTFTRSGGIVQSRIRREVDTGADGSYEVELVPGTYQVTVRLEDQPLPPFRREELSISGGNLVFNVELPDPESYYRIEGRCVRQRTGAGDYLPVAGARVTLLSGTGGTAVSTATETDTDGDFSVTALPNEQEYLVRIGPGESNNLVPELVLEPIAITGSTDLGVLMLGIWDDPLQARGSVFGQNDELTPVEGATVLFEQDLELGNFSQLTRADESGDFSVDLIPGSYVVTVVPPADTDYGAGSFDEVEAEDTIETPPLQHKPTLEGTLLGPLGDPVPGVTITAEPTGYDVSLLALGAVTADSDDEGWYRLSVHPGSQHLTFRPPEDLGLASVIADLGTVEADLRLDVRLTAASTLSGALVSPEGSPVDGAIVEAFVDVAGEMVAFGLTETDFNGRFVLNLPKIGL